MTLALLLFVPGCMKKKTEKQSVKSSKVETKADVFTMSDASFAYADDLEEEQDLQDDELEGEEADPQDDDYTWMEPDTENALKTVYFGFDKAGVDADQVAIVKADAEQLKSIIAEAKETGLVPTIVIEGHSCHAAGTPAYNLALSEHRANEVAKALKAEGIDASVIKVVGRGQEMPAVVNGKQVTGTKDEQNLNRRVEFHLINA